MKVFFNELFEYSNHFNQLVIDKLYELPDKASEKVIQLQNHIINAHQIWNSRILNEVPFGVLEIHPIEDLKDLDNKNYQDTLKIILAKDLSQKFEYTNTKGQTFTNSLQDILFHIINHSTYHRAQIATECRQYGLEPVVSDYIFYKRQTNI